MPGPCATPLTSIHPEPYLVRRVLRETRDIFTLELVHGDGAPLPFQPGQFLMLYAFGVGQVPISLSGDPADATVLVQTIRTVGAVTAALADSGEGSVLGVLGPYGSAWPLEMGAGRDVLLVAGGIGLAPLRPALYRLLAERGRYRRISLVYGTRTPEDIIYGAELERWGGRDDLQVLVTVDRASTGWKGNVGVVTRLLSQAAFNPENTVAFICGPEVMMRFTATELIQRGVPAERISISLERNMKCGTGFCGHCQFGPYFVCKDGPPFRYDTVMQLLNTREI